MEKYFGSKPHHMSKQIDSLQKAYYEKSENFTGKDTDDFDSKLTTFKSCLGMHGVNQDVWVRAFPLMLTEHAQTFFETDLDPNFNLETMPFDHLLTFFRKQYNTVKKDLRLMDEWKAFLLNLCRKHTQKPSFILSRTHG